MVVGTRYSNLKKKKFLQKCFVRLLLPCFSDLGVTVGFNFPIIFFLSIPTFPYPSSLHYFPLSLYLSCPSFPQLKEFIQASGVGAGPAWPRALEIVEGNVRWHRLHRRQFYQWLRKPPNLG